MNLTLVFHVAAEGGPLPNVAFIYPLRANRLTDAVEAGKRG